MSDADRPNPDDLLNAIQAQEERARRGALRVFLGMSAGVGKTFAMLEAARARAKEGVDVVIGIVETHGRADTQRLTEGCEILPRRRIAYKGVELEEMDLDAVLKRKPELVLVDELAHTNVTGSRHSKRYQDVLEILASGIDVYTTINVQHLESRKDLVEKITQVLIRETVPDSVLENAAQIEVIDITPAELLQRLKEGKVYTGDRAERAAQNFFKTDSLTALREIALRFTAEKVDQELQQYLETKAARGAWQTNERLMVAVSHSPFSERLIRATRRLAYNLEAPWIAVHIDGGETLSDADQAQLSRNIQLARDLKADVITSTDVDISMALQRIARQKNVTQIVVGRPLHRSWRDWWDGSLLDRMVKDSGEFDVHVIRQEEGVQYRRPWRPKMDFETGFLPYWNVFCLFFVIAMASGFLEPVIGYRAVGFFFLLGVLVVGMLSRLGPVIFAAALSAFTWNFFLIPPRLTFAISQPEDLILCLTYFIVAVTVGLLASRLRKHEKLIREREERTNVLYEVLRDISSSREKSEFLPKVLVRVSQVLHGTCGVLLKNRDGELIRSQKSYYAVHVDDKEMAVARWAFDNAKPAGWSTETLSQSASLFIPLEGDQEVVGVLVYQPGGDRKLSLDQENLLHSICRQLALALERHFIENRVRENEKLQQSEKMHQTLLNSISHEMRTPLTAIMASAAALEDGVESADRGRAVARELIHAGDRLNRVIENLLDMSRLNSGVMAIKPEWHDISDLVGVALQRIARHMSRHRVRTEIAPNLPLVAIDFRLMEHALTNLLLNAAAYTPVDSEIKIGANVDGENLLLTVEDSGRGIPADSLAKIFDKFYRVPGSPAGGTGLGLSIVKAIVEFHHGEIRAENRAEGGARFTITLPRGLPPEGPHEPN